jgi:hypothetical protein
MSSISIQRQLDVAADLHQKAHEIEAIHLRGRIGSNALMDAATELRQAAESLEKQANEERDEILARLERDAITTVYSGRPGCACGCKGHHTDSQRSKTLIANKIRAALEDFLPYDVELGVTYVSLETETRLLIAYCK